MFFEEALKTQIETITGLSTKVYPITSPEGISAPYVVYELNSAERVQDLTSYPGLIGIDYQISIVNTSYSGMKSIKRSIVAKLKSFQGTNIGLPIEQLDITNEFENFDSTSKYYLGVIEFTVYYQE